MAKAMKFDGAQRKVLLGHAQRAIAEFAKGVVTADDPAPHDWGEHGGSLWEGYLVRHTAEFIAARSEFTHTAAKMLKAKSAHEKTIHTLCRKIATRYIGMLSATGSPPADALANATKELVDLVLAEAGREYVRIEPNFLVKHETPDEIVVGRVRSMPTELAATKTILAKNPRVRLEVGEYPEQRASGEGITLCMPPSVWVIDVPATKENAGEEARWLIDVAVSMMRLSTNSWSPRFPRVGDREMHPIYPTIYAQPHVTMEDDSAFTGGGAIPGWYQANADVVEELNAPDVQARAAVLFDPAEGSLAQRVAQGLGWMTRGRQQFDRSERLLCLFTALEALLSSTDKNTPVTQTISRHASVIYTNTIEDRITVFNHLKSLYSLRSEVIHSGSRVVLWNDVNRLQIYVESIYWLVLKNCDLSIKQARFAQSLTDASHGARWEFSKQNHGEAD